MKIKKGVTLDLLKVFIEYAESNCSSNIHKILGISRPTMWDQIHKLQDLLGFSLVEGEKPHMELTEEGKLFLSHAKKTLETFEEGVNNSRLLKDQIVRGTFVFSLTQANSYTWAGKSLKDFHDHYPGLKIKIIGTDKLENYIEDRADILLRPIGNNLKFIKKWYTEYSHGLFASEEYLRRRGEPKVAEDLLNHSILAYDGEFSCFEDINWHISGHPNWGLPKLDPITTTNSTASLLMAAVGGAGICSAITDHEKYYSHDIDSNKKLIRVLPQITGPTCRTYFCTKVNVTKSMKRNIDIFETFFKEQTEKIGVKIHYEPGLSS